MSTSEERKRELQRASRIQRQNEAHKAQQVVDAQEFNQPFKFQSAPTRKSLAAKNAASGGGNGASGERGTNLTILSINIRLYTLSLSNGKTNLMKTNITNPNSLEIMTHTMNITTNNSNNEIITINFTDLNKNQLLSLQIDPLFAWTLLPIGTQHDLNATLGSFSHDGTVYGVLTHDIDAISRWILLSRYYSMLYEYSTMDCNWIDQSQDIVPPVPTAPVIMESDIVKVSYSIYAVKSLCDYVQSSTSGGNSSSGSGGSSSSGSGVNNSILLTKEPSVMFTVGQGECNVPGIEAAVVGMRKRNVKALVIRREELEDDDNEDWPIKIKRNYFLVVEIAILNHRQSTEEAINIKSVVLDDQQHQTMQQQRVQQSVSIPKVKKSKKNQHNNHHNDNDDDDNDYGYQNSDKDDDLFGEGKSVTKKKNKKATTTNKSSKKGKPSGPFADSNDEDSSEGSDNDENDDIVVKSSKKSSTTLHVKKDDDGNNNNDGGKKVKRSKQQRVSSSETVPSEDDNDDNDTNLGDFDDDEEEIIKGNNKTKTSSNNNAQVSLPVFQLPGMTNSNFDMSTLPPAITQQPQQTTQQQHQPQNPTDEKANLAERMKKLASNSGMGGMVAPTFLPQAAAMSQTQPSQQLQRQQSPMVVPSPQSHPQQHPQQQQQQQQQYYQQPQQQQYYHQQQQSNYQPQQQYQQPQQNNYSHNHTNQMIITSPTTSNPQHTIAYVLAELQFQQYTTNFAREALSTIDDLLLLTDADWAQIDVPTGVKRKIRTHIANIGTNNTNTSSTKSISTSPPPTTPKASSIVNDDAINDAYERGKQEMMTYYMNKINTFKTSANEKFQAQNDEISQLKQEIETITYENQRNKDIVRQYVEKQRTQQSEQTQQLQLLQNEIASIKKQAQIDVDVVKAEHNQQQITMLESVYLEFSSKINNNDVLDGQQVNKALKEVLKKIMTQNTK